MRYGDDTIIGFEYRSDANGFLADLRVRLAKFALELHSEKTRLIEFGRFAAQHRKARGLGAPETFNFLGFTHICDKDKSGRFWIRRITISKRLRAKLSEVKHELMQRRHQPIPEQGRWVRSVVQGHLNYYAVPGNHNAIEACCKQITRHWYKALRRRSQRKRLTWGRMTRLAQRWVPPARVQHTHPNVRFDARHPR